MDKSVFKASQTTFEPTRRDEGAFVWDPNHESISILCRRRFSIYGSAAKRNRWKDTLKLRKQSPEALIVCHFTL